MPDIRKMLEKQLETLQDASMSCDVAAECTYAMLAVVDVLYPEGIPEATSKLTANVKLDTDGFVAEVVGMLTAGSMATGPLEKSVACPKIEDLYLKPMDKDEKALKEIAKYIAGKLSE